MKVLYHEDFIEKRVLMEGVVALRSEHFSFRGVFLHKKKQVRLAWNEPVKEENYIMFSPILSNIYQLSSRQKVRRRKMF
ncbi:hypothetical protein BHE94_04035 [Bacillus pumilus]|nr:hypothetical protein BHE94_04035 [Bacillus pumilus]